jgi:uncharacterized RmlC-like cupin family protein
MKSNVVRAADRRRQTSQTSGMVREEAIHSDKMWAGIARTAPNALSGWHHHGDYESAIYVLSGHVRVECGAGGRTVLDAGPGDFLVIPAGEVHREGNPVDTTSEIVVVRAGQGEVVVNVDGPA